jgi:hypothetical protein
VAGQGGLLAAGLARRDPLPVLGLIMNTDVARAAGLIAVSVLPAAAGISGYAYQHPWRL